MKVAGLMLPGLLVVQVAQAQLNPEQESIRQTFFAFLKFYQQHERTFNSFRLYKGSGKENGPPYRIQWNEVEKYFAYLRKQVPYVGEAYINAERHHFKESDSLFRVYPTEEIAMGFDYDRWAGGQEEIAYTIPWYISPDNKYVVNISGTHAELRIGSALGPGTTEADRSWSIVPFVKENGKWKMADNVYPAD